MGATNVTPIARRYAAISRRAAGEPINDIADSFGVSRDTIRRDLSAGIDIDGERRRMITDLAALREVVRPSALGGDPDAIDRLTRIADTEARLIIAASGWEATA